MKKFSTDTSQNSTQNPSNSTSATFNPNIEERIVTWGTYNKHNQERRNFTFSLAAGLSNPNLIKFQEIWQMQTSLYNIECSHMRTEMDAGTSRLSFTWPQKMSSIKWHNTLPQCIEHSVKSGAACTGRQWFPMGSTDTWKVDYCFWTTSLWIVWIEHGRNAST